MKLKLWRRALAAVVVVTAAWIVVLLICLHNLVQDPRNGRKNDMKFIYDEKKSQIAPGEENEREISGKLTIDNLHAVNPMIKPRSKRSTYQNVEPHRTDSQEKEPQNIVTEIRPLWNTEDIDYTGQMSNRVVTVQQYQLVENLIQNLGNTTSRPSIRRTGRALEVFDIPQGMKAPAWQVFHNGVNQHELYPENDDVIEDVLHDLATQPITDVLDLYDRGTQIKLLFTFGNGAKAIFKPGRFSIDKETQPDHFYFSDYERHNAEIATFHLDRILGFRRAAPAAGRILNMTYDIRRHADKQLAPFIFVSPGNNICIFGDCSQYCKSHSAICGNPDIIQGVFIQLLPSYRYVPRTNWKHPYRRSYDLEERALWENHQSYCEKLQLFYPYNKTMRMLYIVDMALMDFLTGNMDRHHYDTFEEYNNDTFTIHMDHGRGFGRSNHDEMSILAPLYQCCFVRRSTLVTLLRFFLGPEKLSEAMRRSTSRDTLFPILSDAHLYALDRRLEIILRVINSCVNTNRFENVVLDDGI